MTDEQGLVVENGEPLQDAPHDFDEIPNSAAISEHDFERWFRSGELKFPKTPEFGKEAAITAAKLNHPSAFGVTSTPSEGALSVEQLLVVRTPFIDFGSSRFEGSIITVFPGPVVLPPGISGVNPKIVFHQPIPGVNSLWQSGVCGPVALPGMNFESGLLGGFAYNANQSMYGSNKFSLGKPRTTLGFPVVFNGKFNVNKLACSIYEPPSPPPQPICINGVNPTTGALIREECNGVDDNCNGLIDEVQFGDPCSIPQCSTCVPLTCGANRCVSLPDGCGAVLACGCP